MEGVEAFVRAPELCLVGGASEPDPLVAHHHVQFRVSLPVLPPVVLFSMATYLGSPPRGKRPVSASRFRVGFRRQLKAAVHHAKSVPCSEPG